MNSKVIALIFLCVIIVAIIIVIIKKFEDDNTIVNNLLRRYRTHIDTCNDVTTLGHFLRAAIREVGEIKNDGTWKSYRFWVGRKKVMLLFYEIVHKIDNLYNLTK